MTYHGLLLIDKPVGYTSHDVVGKVRRILNQKSIGHTGTLDPMASGLMVLVLGEATKLSNYILDGDKGYELDFRLGLETDTFDVTGQILKESNLQVSPQNVVSMALQLKGEFLWPVPIFSAKKVDGEKLYEKARRGESVEVPQKTMRFWDILSLGENRFRIFCSKGTYIRTWINQLGMQLGCGAAMSSLRRIYSQPYRIEQSQTLEQLESDISGGVLPRAFIDVSMALLGVKRLIISGQNQTLLKNGQISHDLRRSLIGIFDPEKDEMIQIIARDHLKLMALVGLDAEKGFCIRRVFNL